MAEYIYEKLKLTQRKYIVNIANLGQTGVNYYAKMNNTVISIFAQVNKYITNPTSCQVDWSNLTNSPIIDHGLAFALRRIIVKEIHNTIGAIIIACSLYL